MVPGRGHRDGDPFCLVDTLNCPLEEPANPNLTMNLRRRPVLFGFFRRCSSISIRGSPAWYASIIMIGLMVFSLRRFESAGQRLLHTQTAAFCDCHVQLGLFDVDRLDRDRKRSFRTRLDLVRPGQTWDTVRGF